MDPKVRASGDRADTSPNHKMELRVETTIITLEEMKHSRS